MTDTNRCIALTKDGSECRNGKMANSDYCASHQHLGVDVYGENCIPKVVQVAVGDSILYALCVDGSLWVTSGSEARWWPVNMERA